MQQWILVMSLAAVIVVVLAGLVGYLAAKQNSSTSLTSGPSRLEMAIMFPPPPGPIEPITEPIQISPLPEAMLQLLSLKEGESASMMINGVSSRITKGCYDKWTVSSAQGSVTYESWGDLTTALFKAGLNASQFVIGIHDKTFYMANAGPRLMMQSAAGEAFDIDSQNHPPIYTGHSSLEAI